MVFLFKEVCFFFLRKCGFSFQGSVSWLSGNLACRIVMLQYILMPLLCYVLEQAQAWCAATSNLLWWFCWCICGAQDVSWDKVGSASYDVYSGCNFYN